MTANRRAAALSPSRVPGVMLPKRALGNGRRLGALRLRGAQSGRLPWLASWPFTVRPDAAPSRPR